MSATDTKVSELEEKIGNVPTKVSEFENDANYQSASQVDARIQEVVAGLSNTLEALNATVQILQSKVDVLTKTNTEVVSVDGSAGELKDSSKDYIVSGSINENAEIVGKSISLKSAFSLIDPDTI